MFDLKLMLVMLFATLVWIQNAHAQCTVGNDLLTWDQVTPRPDPPEKQAPGESAPIETPVVRADTHTYPFVLAGKFLSKVDADRRYCTAQVVGNTNILLTAAHCVRNKNGKWLHEFEYSPADPAFVGPPIAKAKCVATKSNWKTEGHWYWPADYAFIVLDKPIAKRFLRIDSSSMATEVTTIGYPLDIDGGNILQEATIPFNRFTFPGALPGEDFGTTILSDRRFELGASGGGWFVTSNNSTEFRVIGVNASINDNGPFGPVFGNCAEDLLKFVMERCPTN